MDKTVIRQIPCEENPSPNSGKFIETIPILSMGVVYLPK